MDRALTHLAQRISGSDAVDTLPRLREDLRLVAGHADSSGQASWRIYDPLRHRFIAIDLPTFTALSLWRSHDTLAGLAAAMRIALKQSFERCELENLVHFLAQNNLVDGAASANWRPRAREASRHQHGLVMSLVHNYLFFKVPLFAPEPFLHRMKWLVEACFTRAALLCVLICGVVGLFLVSRQWDEFLKDARGLSSVAGLAEFGIALFVVKVLHEFGHAFAAHRYGCRVPVIGIAFMMMAPVLYTDVTDAWRLADRRQRVAIDAAGISVEIALACIATFLWAFLPEGVPRHMAFLIATTSWLMSFAINLNPLMRFDGYYIFADLLRIENLQSRAFAFGTWWLREVLFRVGVPPPEVLPRSQSATLIGYAWCVWIYRVGLFTGIALAVYAYFFKALGIMLFAFEIGYFLARPIASELAHWWQHRKAIMATRRTQFTLACLAATAILLVVPWSSSVTIPAVLEAADVAKLHAPRAGRVIAVPAQVGMAVRKGDALLNLEAPDLDHEQRTATARLNVVRLRLDRLSADKEDRDDKLVLEGSMAALLARLEGLHKERAEFIVRAPIDGIVSEVNPLLHEGRWVGPKDMIALVRGNGKVAITGYVAEGDLWRIEPGDRGRFIPDIPLVPARVATLATIAVNSAPSLDIAELGSPNGGRIEAQADGRQRLIPSGAHYGVTFVVEDLHSGLTQRHRGVVQLQGRAESYLAAMWRRILKVIVRESAA
jgi:putative peptide zinc metalloprotease protein